MSHTNHRRANKPDMRRHPGSKHCARDERRARRQRAWIKRRARRDDRRALDRAMLATDGALPRLPGSHRSWPTDNRVRTPTPRVPPAGWHIAIAAPGSGVTWGWEVWRDGQLVVAGRAASHMKAVRAARRAKENIRSGEQCPVRARWVHKDGTAGPLRCTLARSHAGAHEPQEPQWNGRDGYDPAVWPA